MPVSALSPILIVGPTASGKSSLAVALAERTGGWVVNADSMQVYAGWHLLTARPGATDEARAPHHLYGHVDPDMRYSVGAWLREVTALLAEARGAGALPIIVGGTGLYFTALTQGLSAVPPIPDTVRAEAEEALVRGGAEAFRRELLMRDPAAATLDIQNPRRMLRAWEVMEATGRSITDWARETPPPIVPPDSASAFAIDADRDTLVTRIEHRFDSMVEGGMLDEVAAMAARDLDPALPAMKAVGAPPLMAHLRGEISLGDAITQAKTDTRRYAKRQRTWLRNRMADWARIPMGALAEDVLQSAGRKS